MFHGKATRPAQTPQGDSFHRIATAAPKFGGAEVSKVMNDVLFPTDVPPISSAVHGDLDGFRRYALSAPPDSNVSERRKRLNTALQVAANRGYTNILNWTLDNRNNSSFSDRHLVNWNAKSEDHGRSVLWYHTAYNKNKSDYESTMKKLILAGADPFQKDNEGDYPLEYMHQELNTKARQWRQEYLNS